MRPAALAALALLAAGCAAPGPVALGVPAPVAPVAVACRMLAAALPAELLPGVHRRVTTPPSPLTAAWGVPAVTLRCGVPVPHYDPTAFVAVVDGVDWLTASSGSTGLFYSFRLPLVVEVRVPGRYQGAEVLATLTPLIARVATAAMR
ncbi:MAG: DUF3515 family protein [Mycobacteriales bacterium]